MTGDLLSLHDASISTMKEKLHNEGRVSLSSLWTSVALHRSILSQLFRIIASAELLEAFQRVFDTSQHIFPKGNIDEKSSSCEFSKRMASELASFCLKKSNGNFLSIDFTGKNWMVNGNPCVRFVESGPKVKRAFVALQSRLSFFVASFAKLAVPWKLLNASRQWLIKRLFALAAFD